MGLNILHKEKVKRLILFQKKTTETYPNGNQQQIQKLTLFFFEKWRAQDTWEQICTYAQMGMHVSELHKHFHHLSKHVKTKVFRKEQTQNLDSGDSLSSVPSKSFNITTTPRFLYRHLLYKKKIC